MAGGNWGRSLGGRPDRAAQGPRACPETCTLRGAYQTLTLTSSGSCIFASDPLGWVTHIPVTPSPSLRLPPLPTPISRAFLNLRPGPQLILSICHCFFNHPSWEDTYRGTGRPKMGPHTGTVVCVSGSGGRTTRLFASVSQLSGRGLSCTPQLLTLTPRSPSC